MTFSRLLIAIFVSFVLVSCTLRTGTVPPQEAKVERPALSAEEQQEKAMEVFNEILDMSAATDRSSVLPDMTASYEKIIREYPDSYVAQESYMRLIYMDLEDYRQPRHEHAEQLYEEFLDRYPDSGMKKILADAIGRFYYNRLMWRNLLEFTKPFAKEYVDTRKLEFPFFLFLYSEAKFNLGDVVEAQKGFKTILNLFPDSSEAQLSLKRLDTIEKNKGKEVK